MRKHWFALPLQHFADGGDTGAAPAESGFAAASGAEPAVLYGKQETGDAAPEKASPKDLKARYREAIKGEYKEVHDAYIEDLMKKRFKSQAEDKAYLEKVRPFMAEMAERYGVGTDDVDALKNAIYATPTAEEEEEALASGKSVEELRAEKAKDRELAFYRQKEIERQANQTMMRWQEQAQAAQAKYPTLDLNEEIQNPDFAALLKAGIDVETAFTVIHKDDIIPAAMQYTAQAVESKIATSIAANGARPTENGMRSRAAAIVKSDVSQLTKADRDEIARRVSMGEKIRF